MAESIDTSDRDVEDAREPIRLPEAAPAVAQGESLSTKALRLADAIDPFTRTAPPDHLTSTVVAQALRALAAAPEAPAQVPLLYLNPKILDAAGKVAVTGALTWSDTKCAGWTMPVYTAPVTEAPAQAGPLEKLTRLQEEMGLYDEAPAQAAAIKRHNPHMHMVGPNDGGMTWIEELIPIPVGASLYLHAQAAPSAGEVEREALIERGRKLADTLASWYGPSGHALTVRQLVAALSHKEPKP